MSVHVVFLNIINTHENEDYLALFRDEIIGIAKDLFRDEIIGIAKDLMENSLQLSTYLLQHERSPEFGNYGRFQVEYLISALKTSIKVQTS